MLRESYTITVKEDHAVFELREGGYSPEELEPAAILAAGGAIVCHMGDPHLLDCMAARRANETGGIFVLRNPDILFVAYAESNLAWAIGLAYFGKLVADAKYGVDIFEALEDGDD